MPASDTLIFIVDDDRGLLRLIEKTLAPAGFRTATAGSGHQAIDWLAENRPTLMLLDLKLQDIEGKELISHLAMIHRSVPFIIITGQGDERVAADMMKRGALDYLVKDAAFLQFLPEVVQRAVAHLEQEKQLTAAIAERKELQETLLQIAEREQTRIGQDLHDGLGQHLAGIELMSQVLQQNLAAKKLKNEAARAGEIARHVREAISQTRLLARGLSPFVLESEGLLSALKELASRTETIFGIICRFEGDADTLIQDHNAPNHLYRIAQEAVSNAIKHGKAKHVDIELRTNEQGVTLSVKDDGIGIPSELPEKRGIGLRIMQYRASMIGGTLTVRHGSDGGTIVLCSSPSRGNPSVLQK
jgi:signal transduction histidine kinase